MDTHPNVRLAQESWDAIAAGDPGPAFDGLADNLVVENGPGAGPWRHVEGKGAFAQVLMDFVSTLGGDFHQKGRVLYADDAFTVTFVHETGSHPSGDRFDNRAIYIGRLDADGKIDRLWTVDLDTEHCEDFWRSNAPS
jgi:ketosteroid isomerase-like protein